MRRGVSGARGVSIIDYERGILRALVRLPGGSAAELTFAPDEIDAVIGWCRAVARGEIDVDAPLPVAEFRGQRWIPGVRAPFGRPYRWTQRAADTFAARHGRAVA